MCGIAGFLDRRGARADAMREAAVSMALAIRRRGPDSSGVWIDPEAGVALSHRRLAIQDPGPLGHQPMVSRSGRYVITFNGEIYNFGELRRELEAAGARFEGGSDTEVLLATIECRGITAAMGRISGMFAFALWDRADRRLTLGRDRMGEKPLYYGRSRGVFLFGSQLSALQEHPAWEAEVDRDAVGLFLRHGCVPAPRSIFSGFSKLLPGTLLHLEADGSQREETYWDAAEQAREALRDPFRGGPEEAERELERMLGRTISRQMIAGVPLGAFLSGGIDSSLVVALMRKESSAPVRSFTLGFEEDGYDEAPYARRVADALGTRHEELRVSPAQVLGAIPEIPGIFDEPFADSSQVPTFLIAKLTRERVTVSLSGDGADELFSGYERYAWGELLQRRMGIVPGGVRTGVASVLRKLPLPLLDALSGAMSPWRGSYAVNGDRLLKLAGLLEEREPRTLYRRLVSHWGDPGEVLLEPCDADSRFVGREGWLEGRSFRQQMMLADQQGYLPDVILTKVDRACMAVGLESRCPFLDHEIFRFAWSLPLDSLHRDGKGKWILRRILGRHLPAEAFERPKMGFRMPVGKWLRGPLREWAESLISPDALAYQGYFRPDVVWKKWREHAGGTRNWYYQLWDILMFQAWLASQKRAGPGAKDGSGAPAAAVVPGEAPCA